MSPIIDYFFLTVLGLVILPAMWVAARLLYESKRNNKPSHGKSGARLHAAEHWSQNNAASP